MRFVNRCCHQGLRFHPNNESPPSNRWGFFVKSVLLDTRCAILHARGEENESIMEICGCRKYKENAEKAFGSIIPTPAEEFKYSSVSGGVRIDAYIGQGEMIVIPSEIGGVAVTEIAPEAFYTPNDE